MTSQEVDKGWGRRKDDDGCWVKRGSDGIATDYVRSRVSGRPWDDRFYIYELMMIEELCIRGIDTWDDSLLMRDLRQRHPDEYRAIRTELDPGWPIREAARKAEEERQLESAMKRLESDDRTNAIALARGNHLFIQAILRDVSELESYVDFVGKEAEIQEPMVGIQGLTKATSSQVDSKDAPKLTRLDYRIIGALEHDARKPVADVTKELGVSTKTVRAYLESLVEDNVIAFILDWNPGFSSGCNSYVFVTLKPETDKGKFRQQLVERFGNRILMTVSFSNLPSPAAPLGLVPNDYRAEEVHGRDRRERGGRLRGAASHDVRASCRVLAGQDRKRDGEEGGSMRVLR